MREDIGLMLDKLERVLSFHRKMVIVYFISIMAISSSYVAIEMVQNIRKNEIMGIFLKSIDNIPSNINLNLSGSATTLRYFSDSMEIQLYPEDFMGLKHNISVSLTLLVVTMFAIFSIYGLLRHHLRRITITEDRIFRVRTMSMLVDGDIKAHENSVSLVCALSGNSFYEEKIGHLNPIMGAIDHVKSHFSQDDSRKDEKNI